MLSCLAACRKWPRRGHGATPGPRTRLGDPSYTCAVGVVLRARQALSECLPQHTLADRPEHDPEEVALEVLALSDGDEVDLGLPVGRPGERVGVSGVPAPGVGVGGGQD